MKKSTCVITMPRCGSELLMSHLEQAYGLENIDEFFNDYSNNPTKTIFLGGAGTFTECIQNLPVVLGDIKMKDLVPEAQNIFDSKIDAIKEYGKPVLVKAFISSIYFQAIPYLVERLFEYFNVVVLTRKDSLKAILSQEICGAINTWHVGSVEEQAKTREKVSSLEGLSISDTSMIRHIQRFNALNHLYANINQFNNLAVAVTFEQFSKTPTDQLNQIFHTNVQTSNVKNIFSFIDDHVRPFKNIDRIKELYSKFIYRI